MKQHQVPFPSGERPDTSVNMGAVVLLAVLLNVLIFAFIYSLKGTFLRDLFMGRNEIDPARLSFQFLTMYMFCLSIVTVGLKRLKIRREFTAVRTTALPADLDMMDPGCLFGAYEAMTKLPGWKNRLVHTRMVRVLVMWINSQDFERTIQYSRENSEMDVFASDASFRANRLFIWAMPLLGFLGTVYGVSYGIGGFAEFLRGDNVSTEEMMVQVGIITQGLAVAFYTTLVGLVTAGLSAFPNMGTERKEEQLLGELDALVEERLTARMPSVKKSEFPVEAITAMRDDISQMTDALATPMKDLVASIEEGFRRLPSPARYEDVFAQAIAQAGALIKEQYSQLMTGYESHIHELGSQLAGRMEDVSAEFRAGSLAVAKQLEHQARAIEETGSRVIDQQALAVNRCLATIEQAGQTESSRWKDVSAALAEQVTQVGSELARSASSLNESSSRAAQAADTAMQGLAEELRRVTDVGAQINHLLQAVQTYEKALGDIAAGDDFRHTMQELKTHLQTTDALVARLSRPRQVTLIESA